ncbi:N-acetylmuramoyl-L-alanine amidase [Dubosiella muris]|uniref:N-acetylmuramoyl-L-alanine amidase n=1 Tax=Dubosiella muris TaxID=3038133 RepID=A0AC61R580_9FIRM|nr:N-acetylmuramoyl-L-alanine amidase [Dubosiella muris]TGY64954.1 N-acetylmuramoyl-L-alanine amidase [Dubosiella muris]
MKRKKPQTWIFIVWSFLALLGLGFWGLSAYKREPSATLMIDAGHGGYDSGAIGADQTTLEKDLTMEIAYKIGQQVRQLDPSIEVLFTRLDDNVDWPHEETADLQARIDQTIQKGADCFLSIHLNASSNPDAFGYDAFVRPNDAFSMAAASRIVENLEAISYSANRGTKSTLDAPLMVVDNQSIPSMLMEVGFVSNPAELEALKSPVTQNRVAKAIARAYVDTMHEFFKEEETQ